MLTTDIIKISSSLIWQLCACWLTSSNYGFSQGENRQPPMAVMKVLLHAKLILLACVLLPWLWATNGRMVQSSSHWSVHQHVWPRKRPSFMSPFQNKARCVRQQSVISGESLRHQKNRARSWNHDDSTGSMKTFSRVANGVLLTTNGLQMFQTKSLFGLQR